MSKCNPFQKADNANERTIFVLTDKFAENSYARCRNRVYKVVRINKDGVPVLRFFGEVLLQPCSSIDYEFIGAKQPKGRYAKDIDGNLTMKNYVPCKRGDWWKGAVTMNNCI